MKRILIACILLIVLFPLYARSMEKYEFKVSEFEFDNITDFIEKSNKDEEIVISEPQASTNQTNQTNQTQQSQAQIIPASSQITLNADNVYINGEKKRDSTDEEPHRNEPYKIRTAFSYWFVTDKEWSKALTPVIAFRTGFSFPELRKGIFSFSVEVMPEFKYGKGRGDYSLNYFGLNVSVPLVFTFYLKDSHRLSLVLSPFYETMFLQFQELYSDVKIYTEHQFGIAPAVRYMTNLKSYLDFGVEVRGEFGGSFSRIVSGFILDWRI